MEQKSDRLYPSAPFRNIDLEQRLRKIIDVNSLNIPINRIKVRNTFFKEKNKKSKKNNKNYKTLTKKLKTIDTIVIIAKTSSSIMLSLTGIGLLGMPISTATACGLSVGNEVLCDIVVQ